METIGFPSRRSRVRPPSFAQTVVQYLQCKCGHKRRPSLFAHVDTFGQKSHPNRTQFLGDILGFFCIISCKQNPSRVMLWKVLVFLSPVCFFILLTYWTSLWDSWRFVSSAMLMRTQPHLQPKIIGFRPTISWSISGSVFARPGADDKPIIPVISRRIMSV